MTTNKKLLWGTKFLAALFNAPSTGFVFFSIFKDTNRGLGLVYFNTFLAVLLIDALFLYILYELEDTTKEPIDRIPYAIASIMLSVAIIWIGYTDEGALAFAPRISMLLLVVVDLFAWATDYSKQYNTREAQEQRIRDEQVIHRRKADKNAYKKAITENKDLFVNKHVRRLQKELHVEDTPIVITPVVTKQLTQDKPTPENVFELDNGGYGWESPFTGEQKLLTSLNEPYTQKGATIALHRHIKKENRNGN